MAINTANNTNSLAGFFGISRLSERDLFFEVNTVCPQSENRITNPTKQIQSPYILYAGMAPVKSVKMNGWTGYGVILNRQN